MTLPTFILESRSFLDKLSDFYFHSDILSRYFLSIFLNLYILNALVKGVHLPLKSQIKLFTDSVGNLLEVISDCWFARFEMQIVGNLIPSRNVALVAASSKN